MANVQPQPGDQVGATPLSWNSQDAVEAALQEAKRSAYAPFQAVGNAADAYTRQRMAQAQQMTQGPFHAPGGIDQAAGGALGMVNVVANPEHRVFQWLEKNFPTEAYNLQRMPGVTMYRDVDPVTLANNGAKAQTIFSPKVPGATIQEFPSGLSVSPESALHEAIHALRRGRTGSAEGIPAFSAQTGNDIRQAMRNAGIKVGVYGGDIQHQLLDALAQLRAGGFRVK